ncbi:glycosyltransferase family 4 protein [Rhodoflexus caldus]|uniref:glycosyltransferase family 4 protein n=1 Tax=Rhodoflexus caldus TaxID=2891236 RepID=UPI00202A5723|nr:glycosyltransferase family 4 protein [Rhodoflexus caldus]
MQTSALTSATIAPLTHKKTVRVLHAIRQGSIGGGESHIIDLVTHLNKSDYESVILAFSPGAMVDRLRKMGYKVYVIESTNAFDLSTGRQVRNLLKSQQIDLVHVHGTRAFSNLLLPARQLGIPLVYTVHGWSFHSDQSFPVYHARRMAEVFFCKAAQQVITVSAANHLTGQQLSTDFHSVTIPNGVDTERFNLNNIKVDLRPSLGIPADAFVIGFVARLTKQKQPLLMLHAFEKAVQKSGGMESKLHLLMVGDGELRPDVENVINHSELLQKKVCLQGFRTDVPELLAACNAYCLPSLWEGLPIALLEAMAMQLPCVATAVDGTCNVLQNEQNGLLIAPESVDALANALLYLLHDDAMCRKLGKEARRTVEKRFSAQAMADRTAAVYEEVLAMRE